MSESHKTFSFMDVAIFDLLWSLSLWLLVRNTGLTPVARSYKEYSKHNCKLLCERDISRLTPVKKMRLSIPKTASVNVAEMLNKVAIFVFSVHKKYSHSFVKLQLNH